MTNGVQSSQALPTTLHDWERVLTHALLRADRGDSDAIRSFEITPETLAMHCGLGAEHADAAEAAFRRALRSDGHLFWCLQHGTFKTPGNDQPNCMAMLALSLLVDCLLDGVYQEKGQYRAKLAEWLGIDRNLSDLRGIATMWEELVAWLEARIAAGAPFRHLVLPDPGSWSHIGYTRYLSFPTKRDIRLLTKQIGRNSGTCSDPASLVRQLDPVVRSSVASHGLKAAFEDFRLALRSGAASVDHRFWRLVMRAREQGGTRCAFYRQPCDGVRRGWRASLPRRRSDGRGARLPGQRGHVTRGGGERESRTVDQARRSVLPLERAGQLDGGR